MPVTKTAKRALRSSRRKGKINKLIINNLATQIRLAKKNKTQKSLSAAMSTIDRAVKKHIIHPNKAARLKSTLSKLALKKKK